MTHPIILDLQKRYTTKSYDPSKKISQADLDVIYEALRLSASSINSQPWKFIVIESDEAKQRMHDTFANKHQFNQPHIKAASHIILFAHNPSYKHEDYIKVVDKMVADGRLTEENREQALYALAFIDLNTDENGSTHTWAKAQIYIALGNALHTLARLNIDSTCLEGVDSELISEMFASELGGCYRCDVALAIGYRKEDTDYNATLPKSRLAIEEVLQVI